MQFTCKYKQGTHHACLAQILPDAVGIKGVWVDIRDGKVIRKFSTLLQSDAESWYEDCIKRVENHLSITIRRIK